MTTELESEKQYPLHPESSNEENPGEETEDDTDIDGENSTVEKVIMPIQNQLWASELPE